MDYKRRYTKLNYILSHGLNDIHHDFILKHFFCKMQGEIKTQWRCIYPWRVYYEYENTKVFINLSQVYFLLLWVHFLFHCCGAVFSDMRPPCVLLNNTVWLANTVWRNIIVSRQCKTQILYNGSISISSMFTTYAWPN